MTKFRIITFDGGGIRGALSVALLKRLNEKYPSIIQKTNLFAGTSTGSLIALALAYGIKPKDLVNYYNPLIGKAIFTPKHKNPFRPFYDNKNLLFELGRVFPSNLKLKDIKKKVLVVAFEVDDRMTKSWNPLFLNNFPHSDSQYEYAINAAMSSCAVPAYFPSYNRNIDGGVVAANPSTAAIALAIDKKGGKQSIENIHLLSIGTGYNAINIATDTSKWGIMQWAFSKNPPYPLLSLMLDGAIEADTSFSSQFLGDRYFRLNPELDKNVQMDDYKMMDYLFELGSTCNLDSCYEWIERNWL